MFNQTEPQISEASNHLKHLTESEILDVLECARKVSARDHLRAIGDFLDEDP
jgi:hypothetical protein